MQHPNNPYDFVPPIKGMRKIIKQITKHSANGEKAVIDGESWRIPLAAYHSFFQYLSNEPNTIVEPIPDYLLSVASLGRATAARGFASVQELNKAGVPLGLARALAPYQRGGVDFVLQRQGLALIADEMGLGKTVQSIAAMSCYQNEWPLLVLSPSTARFHWKNQFLKWLGVKSSIHRNVCDENDKLENHDYEEGEEEEKKMEYTGTAATTKRKRKRLLNQSDNFSKEPERQEIKLLDESHINVVKSAKGPLLESSNTKVVIASYGLITNLVKNDVLVPGIFKCIIVDESHMLKNKKSKRTKAVLPLLQSADRVVMLSGTPALSRPAELYPQISVLGRSLNVFQNENEFEERYVKDKYSDPSYKELHTMLSNTVMIRRMKEDQLKDMPNKRRENVFVRLTDKTLQDQITNGLLSLRQGTGQLGKLSIIYQKDLTPSEKSQTSATENSNEPNSKVLLNQIYKLTGHAKIPIILDMVRRWLADVTNGKLVIFAHHLDVLNAIEESSGVSNQPGSNTQYIRIDGSTTPQSRQDQIDSFQDDPSIKIALLGITAAGVGVTLTAASTIWFTELFWTPAMMIQAEDRYVIVTILLILSLLNSIFLHIFSLQSIFCRCHRIGQNAVVRCLYIIAKGTIDELLWILLQKKFRALGEFVEGQEERQMVVHTTYKSEFDAVDRKVDSSNDNDVDSDIIEKDSSLDANELANEGFIVHDLEELAKEDTQTFIIDDDREEEDDEVIATSESESLVDSKPSIDEVPKTMIVEKEVESNSEEVNQALGTGDDPICILDDDETDEICTIETQEMDMKLLFENFLASKLILPMIGAHVLLPSANFYYVDFMGPSYHLVFRVYCGRPIIIKTLSSTPKDINFGDIIVRCNSTVFTHGMTTNAIKEHLSSEMNKRRPVRLYFAQDEYLKMALKVSIERIKKKREQSEPHQEAQGSSSVKNNVEVIELD